VGPKDEEVKEGKVYCAQSEQYLNYILPGSNTEDYQSEITKQREGTMTMDYLYTRDYKNLLAEILFHSHIISIEKFTNLFKTYLEKNKSSQIAPSEITFQRLAEEIKEIAFVLRNGFCIVKSHIVFEDEFMQHLRNKIIFTLFDTEVKQDHPSVTTNHFTKYGEKEHIRLVLRKI